MGGVPSRLWKPIENFIEKAPGDSGDKNRLLVYTVFLLLGVPTMAAYGIQSLIRGEYVLCSFVIVSAVGLSAGWYALGRTGKGGTVYRINVALYCALLTYMVVVGGDGGSKILWMYTFPLIAFFLIGKREGVLWAGGILLIVAFLLAGVIPGVPVYPYPKDFKIRFFTTYAIVAAVACWFEHFRESYRAGMETKCVELETERTRLMEALAQVRVLRGLLPICASCKKIRDEHGSWTQIEAYIDERSEAKFSHGICPDCAKRLYPGFQP